MQRFSMVMRETKANPNMIVLEITETTLMKDVECTIRILNEPGMPGLSLAVDDFGTGYSSLSHLMRLPVDSVKVERVFIGGIDKQNDMRSITTAMIDMAHSLDPRVTAEGVESKARLAILRQLGYDTIQGYYFYKPIRVTDLKHLVLQANTFSAGLN